MLINSCINNSNIITWNSAATKMLNEVWMLIWEYKSIILLLLLCHTPFEEKL